uniref:(northern house mosquito) hypothetical protein n=1 Tax=Culex pipiens TaxID=7175 RepID=A0A8D8L4W7_CULPI
MLHVKLQLNTLKKKEKKNTQKQIRYEYRYKRNAKRSKCAKCKTKGNTIFSNWFILNLRLTVSIGLKGSVADNENAPKSTEVTFYNRKVAKQRKVHQQEVTHTKQNKTIFISNLTNNTLNVRKEKKN